MVSSLTPSLKLILLLLNVFEILEDDFLDFSPISWRHIVGIGFFEIEIFPIQPIFTFLLALATVDMSRLLPSFA
jgi:hypothetical protein